MVLCSKAHKLKFCLLCWHQLILFTQTSWAKYWTKYRQNNAQTRVMFDITEQNFWIQHVYVKRVSSCALMTLKDYICFCNLYYSRRNSFTHAFLVSNDLSHADFSQTHKMHESRTRCNWFSIKKELRAYSSNKIRKTQNDHLNIACQNLKSQ